jgi:hypothetical protein
MTPWTMAAAAAAMLAVAIALPALVGSPVGPPHPPAAPVTRLAPLDPVRPVPPLVQPASVAAPRVVAVRRAVPAGHETPVVVVDQRQRAALRLFVRLGQHGRLTEAGLADAEQSTVGIKEQVLPIALEPLSVSPIPVGGVLPDEIERY